jgi:DnaJ-domain-containing protein 1
MAEPKPVPLKKPLAELSDTELQAESRRRLEARVARGQPPIEEPAPEGRVARALEAQKRERELAQHYANLELKPGATLAEVQARYRELVARYHPDKHAKDPEKHRAATELVAQLSKSYQTLLEKLSGQGPGQR